MKRRLTSALVMLLAFALLIGTTAITASAENTAITASAENTTYTPIGGSAAFIKNLVVDSDANIPSISFKYTSRRGTPQDATATTIEILAATTGGEVSDAVFSNDDTASAIPGVPTDDRSHPTPGKKYAQKSVTVNFPVGTFTKPGVYRFVINETNNNLPGVTYDSNPTCSALTAMFFVMLQQTLAQTANM